MKQNMSLLYRYREPTAYNLDALRKCCINGSLYKKFENCGELNFDIGNDFLKKYKITNEEKEKLVNVIITNCKNHYYLSSFSLNEPKANNEEWIKYAKEGQGYCLVYNKEDIKNAIKLAFYNKNQSLELLEVHYSKEPYELFPFFSNVVKKLNATPVEERNDELVKKLFDEVYSNKLGKYLVNSFAHKSSEYRKFNEMRLVLQDINTEKKYFTNLLTNVKPKKIIVGRNANIATKMELIGIAKKHRIAITYS